METGSEAVHPLVAWASVLIVLAGAIGVVIGLVVGSAVVVGVSGGLAGVLVALLAVGHFLGTE
jgi:hypothetical protein